VVAEVGLEETHLEDLVVLVAEEQKAVQEQQEQVQ
jgi:hypothetical protein